MSIDKSTPLKYPRSVAFIVCNEFCERFNYYGLRTILVLYLTKKLHYDSDTATVQFHVFTMLVYFFPLVGAIVADSWLGKFKTIFYLSLVYALGGIIVSLGAIPILHLPVQVWTMVGLFLIAFGTGGIKPCVSAFGGDQFRLPEQAKQLASFFSLFYFAINAGSMISTSLTPIMREDVHCFGEKDCFSLAFGVPAILMLISVIILIAGKRLYVMKPPAGNMIFSVSQCIVEGVRGWRCRRLSQPRDHWLDYAEPKCGSKLVDDTKVLFKILTLYLPFPVFWALFDQQGSRWTFQATRMDGALLGYTIKPDQMNVINPLLILAFIPLFDYVLYPILSKVGIRRPLQKLTAGGLLAAMAFVCSAVLEFKIDAADSVFPMGSNLSHLRIYNGMPCTYELYTTLPTPYESILLKPLGIFEDKDLQLAKNEVYSYNASSSNIECEDLVGKFEIKQGKSTSYFIANETLQEFSDIGHRPNAGDAQIRMLINVPLNNTVITLRDSSKMQNIIDLTNNVHLFNMTHGRASVSINGKLMTELSVKAGGIYVVLISGNNMQGFSVKSEILVPPNSVHMLWQLPQIILITAAEIMFSVTGLEFSFTQAPQSMKSVLQACWLLTVAVGNLLVVVIAELKFFKSQAAEFLLFATLMVIDMFIFALLTIPYKYVVQGDSADAYDSGNARVMAGDDCPMEQRRPKTSETGVAYENQAYTVE